MPFRNRLITILKIFRTIGGEIALIIRGGANSQGNGSAVIQLYSGDASEYWPAELTAYIQDFAPFGQYNSLVIMSPGAMPNPLDLRASVTLQGGDGVGFDSEAVAEFRAGIFRFMGTGIADQPVFQIVSGVPQVMTHLVIGPGDGTGWIETNSIQQPQFGRLDVEYEPWEAATFSGTWVDYGAAGPARSVREPGPFASLSGLVKNATLGATGTILTLPSGHEPLALHVFLVVANTGYARVYVQPTGIVELVAYGGGGNAGFVQLSGLRWPID